MNGSTWQPGVELRDLPSHVLNQDLQLSVKLPWTYEQGDQTYPTLYCLDANRSFPLWSTLSLVFETPGFNAPEILLVGVGYKLDPDRIRGLAQWAAWRTRDLTPVPREGVEQYWREALSKILGGGQIDVATGGASLFLRALGGEVIPFIEDNYRASPIDRGLAGYSYGGLFALTTLFQAPELFTRYYAGSPSLWDAAFEMEEAYAAAHDDLRARLLITAGDGETELLEPLGRLIELLRGRGYAGLDLQTHIFAGESHTSCMAAAAGRALRTLYYDRA